MPALPALIERMASFAVELEPRDIPGPVMHFAASILADTLTCAIAGGGEDLIQALAPFVAQRSAPAAPQVTLLPASGRASLSQAVLLNTAAALVRRQLTQADYHGEPWKDPAVRDVMDRIRLVEEPERERARVEKRIIGCHLTVSLRDGRTLSIEVEQPRGHPDAPMTDEQLLSKLTELLAPHAPPDAPARLLAVCRDLVGAPSLDPLLAVVRSCQR